MYWLKCSFYTYYASREGYGESANLIGLSLSLRHRSKISCWLKWRFIQRLFCASSEGFGESAQLYRLALAFVTVPNYHVLSASNGDLCAIHASSVNSGESALW